MTKEKPTKKFPKVGAIKPDFSEIIGKRMTKERNLQGKLKLVQADFDSAKQKSENTSPVGKGHRATGLQRATTALKLAKFDIEHFPIVIDFHSLRAEIEWQKTVIEELREKKIEIQTETDKQKAEFTLMEKYGFIKTNS